eukprot:RCo034862
MSSSDDQIDHSSRGAVRIQCCFRQWRSRRIAQALRRRQRLEDEELRRLVEEEEDFNQIVAQVVRIQCAWRAHVARRRLRERRELFESGVLQQWWALAAAHRQAREEFPILELRGRIQVEDAEASFWGHLLRTHSLLCAESRGRRRLSAEQDKIADALRVDFEKSYVDATFQELYNADSASRKQVLDQEAASWKSLSVVVAAEYRWMRRAVSEDVKHRGSRLRNLLSLEERTRTLLLYHENQDFLTIMQDHFEAQLRLVQRAQRAARAEIVAEQAGESLALRQSCHADHRRCVQMGLARQKEWRRVGDLLLREAVQRERICGAEGYTWGTLLRGAPQQGVSSERLASGSFYADEPAILRVSVHSAELHQLLRNEHAGRAKLWTVEAERWHAMLAGWWAQGTPTLWETQQEEFLEGDWEELLQSFELTLEPAERQEIEELAFAHREHLRQTYLELAELLTGLAQMREFRQRSHAHVEAITSTRARLLA